MAEGRIRVEVAYALPERQALVSVEVPEGSTMVDAVVASRIAEQFPGQIDPQNQAMGIFGKIEANPRGRVLQDGDRVEIYRPLQIDPKDSRKERTKRVKEQRAG